MSGKVEARALRVGDVATAAGWSKLQNALATMAADGWRLVAVVADPGQGGTRELYFERAANWQRRGGKLPAIGRATPLDPSGDGSFRGPDERRGGRVAASLQMGG